MSKKKKLTFFSKHPTFKLSLPLLAIISLGIIYFLYTQPSYLDSTSSYQQCPEEGRLPKENYLETYIVKPGDSILSISNNELGDPSRAEELIQLNKDTYPELSLQNSFLEQGWKLVLPPTEAEKTNGIILVSGGRVSKSDVGWGISWLNTSAGPFDLKSLPDTIDDSDCAVIIYQGRDIEKNNSAIEVIKVIRQE